MIKTCKHCNVEFDTRSSAKRQAGGKINECPSCVEELGTETAVKYLGLSAGDGKASALSIVAFESDEDREAYSSAWKAVTGFNKGKSCHLSKSNIPMNGMKFRRVGENFGNSNHKGKL